MRDAQESEDRMQPVEGARSRLVVSAIILALFWGALIYEYWPELMSAAMRLFNSTRMVGAEVIESQYFEVRNISNASDRQVRSVVRTLEQQYGAITQYLEMTPPEKLQVLVVNGRGPALMDGSQLVINYDNGRMDFDLAPLYLVLLVENMPINMAEGLAPAGGHALQVIEAAGQGNRLIRQPLDHWVALFRREGAYLPLEEVWKVPMPNDDPGIYQLARAMLEAGSFMRWYTAQYGMPAAITLAHAESVAGSDNPAGAEEGSGTGASSADSSSTGESPSLGNGSSLGDSPIPDGQSLADLEQQWLKTLDQQHIEPKSCSAVIPRTSLYSLICREMDRSTH